MIEYRITFKGISDPDQYAPEGHHSDPFEGSFKEALVHLRAGRKTAQDCGLPANHARLEVRTVSCWEGERIMRAVNQGEKKSSAGMSAFRRELDRAASEMEAEDDS